MAHFSKSLGFKTKKMKPSKYSNVYVCTTFEVIIKFNDSSSEEVVGINKAVEEAYAGLFIRKASYEISDYLKTFRREEYTIIGIKIFDYFKATNRKGEKLCPYRERDDLKEQFIKEFYNRMEK